jgi:hypothetical protein
VAAAPESVHTPLPLPQASVPVWHGADEGVHVDPAAHGTQAPLLQTIPVPQPAPFATLPVDVQMELPVAHDVVPAWQRLPPGVHGWPGAHVLQVPFEQ